MKNLDPVRDDAGARLRRLHAARGAGRTLRGNSRVLVHDRERPPAAAPPVPHHRALRRPRGIPLYLAYGIPANPCAQAPRPLPAPFPSPPDSATLSGHGRLAGELVGFVARGDGRAAGDWLRRLAREPGVSPWLLIDQLARQTAR